MVKNRVKFDDLKKELLDAKTELFRLRIKKSIDQLPKVHLIRETKRKIARILTELTNRKVDK